MIIATCLISSLINFASSWDVPFCQLQQLQHLHHGSIKAYVPLFPFLSPLPRRWRFAVHALWLQCETWVSAVLAGALLTLFFTWNVTQSVQSSWKQSLVIHGDWATHPLFWLITGAYSDDQTFCIFRNGWIDCRDVFHAVLYLYHCVKNNRKLKGRGMQVKCMPCPFN